MVFNEKHKNIIIAVYSFYEISTSHKHLKIHMFYNLWSFVLRIHYIWESHHIEKRERDRKFDSLKVSYICNYIVIILHVRNNIRFIRPIKYVLAFMMDCLALQKNSWGRWYKLKSSINKDFPYGLKCYLL